MQAMIFAAGLGTRLFPITKDKPKALAPFLDTTLLAYNLKYLAQQGITDFIINTHHFAEKIELYLEKNSNFGLNIRISYEDILLDTAGGLAKARKYFSNEKSILLFNVDIITNINIAKLIDFHNNNNASATLAIRKRDTSRYFLFNKENELKGWINKNTKEVKSCTEDISEFEEYAFSGIHIINTELIKDFKEVKQSITPFYLEKACDTKIVGYRHDSDYWIDCGKIDSLQLAEKHIRNL
ncbi:MAG: NTP transferase domain-containing protein [Bacteroidales bacterium]|nr:NTP transferase domain-containing protein [Bacteroidales bacterium]